MNEENMTVAFIPVRGGSKSIPLKNIKTIAGKPLVCWSMEAAMNCKYIDKVFICTDSEEIKSVINQYLEQNNNDNGKKVYCISRSDETASDTASTEMAMLEFAQSYDFKTIILVQATSPTLTSDDLSGGIEKYYNESYDSILSVVRQKRFIWKENQGNSAEPVNYEFKKRPRRQEFDGYLVENGAFYITSKSKLVEQSCRISGNIGLFEMHEDSYYEIDELSDWIIVDKLLDLKKDKEEKIDAGKKFIDTISKKITEIKMVLTDCDGVLTDGGMYYNHSGDEMKKFNTRDGMGFKLLSTKGYIVGIITGENTDILKRRAEKLNIKEVHLGIQNKLNIVQNLAHKYNIELKNIAYIGDDINDLEVIKAVGFGCCTADAISHVKENAVYITNCRGGEGAFRELADLISTV